jgi:hypothetical protein
VDKRAAGQYLDRIFAGKTGYVAVAYKDKGQSWQECQFQWPAEKAKLIGWAEVHQDANVFVCPALRRSGHTRRKGDMEPSRWLWADVDWQGVPADRQQDVKDRISELSSFTVASGTGDNVHVYVELNQPVEHAEFIKLNTGLRDYLYADNKQADNSLLRLPGTTNWKTDAGSPVRENSQNAKTIAPASLMKRRVFRDAKVLAEAEALDWEFIEVEGLPRRMRSLVEMPVAEAEARYGSRYKAVWAITGELHKRGLGADEIHSLMDKFPAALDKMAEENGYDVHRDVDKRILWDRSKSIQVDDDVAEDAGDIFEEMSEDEVKDSLVNEGVEKELLRRAIRRAADMAEAERTFTGPPDDVSWSLSDALNTPPRPVPYLIAGYESGEAKHKGLAGAKHNVVITAQYKTGKTIFVTGTLARSLCDGVPFLDRYPVNVPDGGTVVGHWNCEMDPAEMLDDYIRPVGIHNAHNLHVANLRGYSVNILSDQGKAWAVSWLKERQVKVWTIDSFARVARMAGVSEKDNDEVMALLMRLDEIKVEAECDALFLITHTGRAEMEEGKERARGATAIDDWADARWIMTKMDDTRFLAVEGRSVAMSTTSLHFDNEKMRYEMGYGNKADVKADGATQAIVKVVRDNPGITQAGLWKILGGEPFKMGRRVVTSHVEEAESAGFVVVKKGPRPGGGRAIVTHWLAGEEGGDDAVKDRRKAATPGVVDLRGVTVRQSRRRS